MTPNANENQAEKHSAERSWSLGGTFEHIRLTLWESIILTGNFGIVKAYESTKEKAESNAARIVACVNACRAIQDPEEAISDIRSFIERHTSELDKVNTELSTLRKELEAAKKAELALNAICPDETQRTLLIETVVKNPLAFTNAELLNNGKDGK